MASSTCISWENFHQIHNQQLQSIGLPEHLWQKLYSKLAPKVFHDVGSSFERRKSGEIFDGRWALHSKKGLKKDEDVFLVDHAWTNDGGSKAKEILIKKPELVKRMEDLMCLSDKERHEEEDFLDQEKVVQQLGGVNEEKAKECLEKSNNDLIQALLNAEGNDKIKGPEINLGESDEKQLDFKEFKYGFTASLDEESKSNISEEFIEKMYKKYLKDAEESKIDALPYGQGTTAKYSWQETDELEEGTITVLVSVSSEVKKSSISSKVTSKGWALGLKGCEPLIHGEFYGRIVPDECFWMFDGPGVIQMTLQKADTDDRLWPVLIKEEKQLSSKQIFEEARDKEQLEKEQFDSILDNMWYYNQTYGAVLVKGGHQEHVWYIMDEYGSALSHSSTPNIKCAPFAYAVTGVIHSLIWPIRDINKEALCTRNFCPPLTAIETPVRIEARTLACLPEMPDKYPSSFLPDYAMTVPTAKYTSHDVKTIPLVPDSRKQKSSSELKLSFKFFIEESCENVKSVLSALGCSFVEKPEEAEALWVSRAIPVTSSQKVNNLSGDEFLVRRDVLSRMIHEKLGEVPWYPVSYNLRSHLPGFCVEHYMKGMSAMWIVRSANPSELHVRPVISSNLRRIIRLGEMGPLVASQFCVSVAVSHQKHFCLQYSVVIPSLKPLELLVHNTPRIRRTLKKFDPMDDLDEYDSSSVITTQDDAPQNDEYLDEFAKDFKKHYLLRNQQTWDEVQKKIYQNIYELFFTVLSSLSEPGKVNDKKEAGRLCAVYGVDVLLLENLSPVVIGVNALPSFANDQVAKEVLYLAYSDEELPTTVDTRVTKVTCEN